MGVKHFFYWFKDQFSEKIIRVSRNQTLSDINVGVDTLMLDMNGIFHNSAQKIYEYGNFKPRSNNSRLLSNKIPKLVKPQGIKTQLALFEDVCKTIEHIFKIVQPRKNLVLCVDGPAPLSKQSQQRSRRFRSAMEQTEESNFNSNCITPGTKFMDYLTKYVDWYIRKRINEEPIWRKVNVVFSNEKACGEGEQKLINYIRYYGCQEDSYCIYGLDADLIMLGLGTHLDNFYILRDDMYNLGKDFFCVNIGSIRDDLANLLRWKEEKYRFDKISAINDFIFMCFMVGNDFLPHIPSIEIIEKGIELMIEIYKETCTYYGHITTNLSGHVYFRNKPLGILLDTIGQHEKTNFEHKLRKKESFFPDPLLESCSRQVKGGEWDVDIDKYKVEYFSTCFPKGTDERKLCHDYLEGMQWVLTYYTHGVPNWKWYFPYHYAPPASIIAKYTDSYIQPHYGRTIPTSPFLQLLCVLPPKSADLIPDPLNKLLSDESSPLKKYCPDVFDIDLSGKRREWEGIVILPMIDFNIVRECYLDNLPKIDEKELKRNKLGKSFVYKYIPLLNNEFRSYYGTIDNCCVEADLIEL